MSQTEHVRGIIKAAAKEAFGLTDLEPEISRPESKFGDFSTNLPFQLAGQLHKSPKAIAQELAAAVKAADVTARAADPGYVNLTMSDQYWLERLNEIEPDYGRNNLGNRQKLQVEYISANPTGPTTIGNARGGFIGDVLANILEYSGYDVTREYYFNNAGTQISKLLESVKFSAGIKGSADPEDIQYRGDYIEELAWEFKEELTNQTDEELKELLTKTILERWIKPAVIKMGIKFDVWFNEADLIKDGSLAKVLDRMKEKGLVFERDGAVWLDGPKLKVERGERVLIKSNGDPSYLAPDIAYHANIFGQRNFDVAIKVLGPDHIDQFPSVKAAVLALYPKRRLEMVGHQWFRLMRDGREVKVSKRLGQFVTIEQLIEEVGEPVARFFTLMRSAESQMDFDLNLAKEQSQKNPYWYVMYAYVRAGSILEQAKTKGLKPAKMTKTLNPAERRLVSYMTSLPELVTEIAQDYAVHRLAFYGIDLARAFHDYYESERIINLPEAESSYKLYLIQQFRQLCLNYFSLLGVAPIEKM